jgi:hypothetical protein
MCNKLKMNKLEIVKKSLLMVAIVGGITTFVLILFNSLSKMIDAWMYVK